MYYSLSAIRVYLKVFFMVTVYKFVDKKLNIGTAYIGTPNMLKRFGNFHPVSPPFIIPYRYDIDRYEKFNDFN